MRLLTSALLASTLVLGTAGIASAQLGGLTDKAKDVAVDKAKDSAVDAAKSYGSGSIGSTTLSDKEKLKAGKVIIKGGSTKDAAMTIGKDRVEDAAKETVKSYGSGTKDAMKDKASSYGSGTKDAAKESYGSGTSSTTTAPAPTSAPISTPSAPVIACPAGTTAQPNGTCMVTGNWSG